MHNRTYKLLIAVGITAVLAGCGHSSTGEQHANVPGTEISAQLLRLGEHSLPVYATFPGSISSADQVQIASRLTGYVRKLYVHEGQLVKKGELLLSVDPTDVKGGIAQAHAVVAKAAAALADAQANFERYKALYEQHAVPQQQFQQVELGYKVAKGNYAAALSALQTARSQLNYADVRAPFDGVVVSKFIDSGQLAAPGQPLLTLQSAGHLQVRVQVDGQAFTHMSLGQNVSVTFDDANFQPHTVQGLVERMVSAADPMTHTHTVKIGLPANAGAASGDYARVQVSLGDRQGIVVPVASVLRRAGIEGVFVVGKDGIAQFRMVRLGERMGDKVVVLAGLVAGDRIVIDPQGTLYNGVRIKGGRS